MAMQPHCRPLFLLLILVIQLLSQAALAEAKKKTQPPPSRSAVPGSGELTTKAGHSCTWATSDSASDSAVALQVSCSVPGEAPPVETYQCRFVGKPDLCPAYAAKANQYWKQVVSKLKKRSYACEGEKVLKTRLCKKAPSASHVRLAEGAAEDKKMEEKEEEEEEEEEVVRGKETAAPVAREAEVAARRAEREGKPEPLLGDAAGHGAVGDGNADSEVSNYCTEGWHSLCSFFVKFFDG
ncbi:fibroblast growth factor-binding protein 3 [Alosa sapidissima]|uniref:fibroblast growth factor-binding protein 3 n=1 Tax=Alosa sapidissima TaxID=34773 RepID=UPI001C08C167|nr:fibroblast growth factor-binding protein 3 [Alosa sapidissima]